MLFMESYVFYCSVRLGVIVVALLSIIRCLTCSCLLFAQGVDLFEPLVQLLEKDAEYKQNRLVVKCLSWLHDSPQTVLIVLQVTCYGNIVAALLGIIGSLQLRKWLLPPLVCFEFVYFLIAISGHVVLMIMLKKLINLGLLIVLTLLGSFYVLYVAYNCATCMAMFQIISLVHSARYRQLYGDDPFHPLGIAVTQDLPQQPAAVQQLRVLGTPDDTDIDEQKRLAKLGLWPKRLPPAVAPTQIISVIPASHQPSHLKWWQQQALDAEDKLHESAVYRNWQSGELWRGAGWRMSKRHRLH